MAHDVIITAAEDGIAGDELRTLQGYLDGEDSLRGLVRLHERAPDPGTLGPVADALTILQAPLGALVGALIAWIRSRSTNVDITVQRTCGAEVTISADRLRQLGAAELSALITQVTGELGCDHEEAPNTDQPNTDQPNAELNEAGPEGN